MKQTKKLLALALSLLLCLSLGTAAFAAYDPTTNSSGPVDTPDVTGIVKTLAIADGTTLPAQDYTFAFTPGTSTDADTFPGEAFETTIASTDMV